MSEIESFLSSIEDDEDQEQEKAPVDPKKLGYALRQEQKEKKAMAKKLAELEEFQNQILAEKRKQALATAGLNDFHAEVFSKFFEEVTDENVKVYKERAGLVQPEPEPEPEVAPEAPRGFAPMQVPGTTNAVRMFTVEELKQIAKTDPARANQLVAEGKVQLARWEDLYEKKLGPR